MDEKFQINKIKSELEEGMGLEKCGKCGCMKQTLENLYSSFPLNRTRDSSEVLKNIDHWLKLMEPIKYECLGCEYCYPAEAMNIFNQEYPEVAEAQPLCCGFEVKNDMWPPVAGEYFFFCDDQSCTVAVSTLASVELAERLASIRPKGLCIVGKTETENIGIDKVIKNTISNPTIRFLLLTGKDSKGHMTGKTFLALEGNGVNEGMRVIGSPGKRPILRNVKREEVEAFRRQIQVVDLIGCEDVEKITKKINLLSEELNPSGSWNECSDENNPVPISEVPVIRAEQPKKVELDKAGYFVIIPQPEKGNILAEHYSYDNKLQQVIEGNDAKSIYSTIIENGWVTQLSHAAYLGRELAKAELSIKSGVKYIQDGA
jgi:tetrahydromethanopterin S-methyltransferase subunit A